MDDAKAPFQLQRSQLLLISFQGPCPSHTEVPLNRPPTDGPWMGGGHLEGHHHSWNSLLTEFTSGKRWKLVFLLLIKDASVLFLMNIVVVVGPSEEELGVEEKGKLSKAGSESITSPNVLTGVRSRSSRPPSETSLCLLHHPLFFNLPWVLGDY